MGINALTDVAWIDTNQGLLTPEDALLRSHERGFWLSLDRPGFEVSAQFRFLLSCVALVVRHAGEPGERRFREARRWLAEGLPKEAVSAALADLVHASDVYDETMPFMQLPPATSGKDIELGPGREPVKKLSSAMPADEGEEYWNLLVGYPSELGLPDALRALTTFHWFSVAGNNRYDLRKPRMGAPGIRFLGRGNAATELVWLTDDESLLASLLTALPTSWVVEGGLPAWADRTAASSRRSDGSFTPLWEATWSSNCAVGFWQGQLLTGVRIGGVPDGWSPLPIHDASGKEDKAAAGRLKEWWDERNTQDPLYLYIPNPRGELKAQRIDFGKDATELAVDWAAQHRLREAHSRSNSRVWPASRTARLRFFRHRIEGTASSPSIRASDVLDVDPSLWGFGLDEEGRDRIEEEATFVNELHGLVVQSFKIRDGRIEVSDTFASLSPAASDEFWRQVTATYEAFIRSVVEGHPDSEALYRGAGVSALRAYEIVTEPYTYQYPQEIFFGRSMLRRRIRGRVRAHKEAKAEVKGEER